MLFSIGTGRRCWTVWKRHWKLPTSAWTPQYRWDFYIALVVSRRAGHAWLCFSVASTTVCQWAAATITCILHSDSRQGNRKTIFGPWNMSRCCECPVYRVCLIKKLFKNALGGKVKKLFIFMFLEAQVYRYRVSAWCFACLSSKSFQFKKEKAWK